MAMAIDESKSMLVQEDDTETKPIPATLLSGFLGSGKMILLKKILKSSDHKLKVALIVNDMAELNVDADLVKQQDGGIIQMEQEAVALQNGCICCTLRGDLISEIARIQNSDTDFDCVLVESTGIAEPQAAVQSFDFDPNTQQLATSEEETLWKQARLDACMTVIDAHMFLPQIWTSSKQFGDQFHDGWDQSMPEGSKEGQKPVRDHLIDQAEFANVILLNMADLVDSKEQLNTTVNVIGALNPMATVLSTEHCKIGLHQILNTGIFDMKKAAVAPGWMREIRRIQDCHARTRTVKSMNAMSIPLSIEHGHPFIPAALPCGLQACCATWQNGPSHHKSNVATWGRTTDIHTWWTNMVLLCAQRAFVGWPDTIHSLLA